jgi:outer membrane protein assembly factor BamB
MTMAQGDFMYNGGHAYEAKTGTLSTSFGEGAIAAYADGVLYSGKGQLAAFKPGVKDSTDRKGQPIKVLDHAADWKIKTPFAGTSLIVAGEVIVSGGEGGICLVDAKSQEVVQSIPLAGLPLDLAAADGRLYVSTDMGDILCFTGGKNAKEVVWKRIPEKSPYGENTEAIAAAEKIIEQSKITEGYAVDLGCGDGALAFELAKRTKLHIVAIDADPTNVETARKKLEAAALYGKRVSVFLGDPANTEFPKYFANLVVSQRSLPEGTGAAPAAEVSRLQRPYGGVACLGQSDKMKANRRGALANAGTWSHLYSDPANTSCSIDEIKGPLRVLWFRDVDVSPPQRHGRGPAPLFSEGRLFAEGLDELRAVDAYNGRPLWKFPLPGLLDAYNADHLVGTAGTGSNVCIADGSVYVRHESYCYRLDAVTGEVQGKFEAPKLKTGKPGRWGYLACEDGVLFGSLLNDEHIVRHAYIRSDENMKQLFSESSTLFALDAKSGKELWRYDAKKSIRNNAIAIGDDRVFLIDRELAVDDLLARAPARRGEKELPNVGHATGELIVLDAKTGKQKWMDDKDIFGTMLVFSDKYDVLLMGYQSTRFKLPSEVGGRLAVFQATDGYRLWDKKMNYVTRPLVNDRLIYAQGGAWDLLSGADQPFDFERSYGCGQISASKNLLLFRSATLGYKDLSRDAGTENFGGIRPGCWINAIPAGGLVLVPDASAGCQCSYQNRTWMALQGSE